jgi:hypothetical protein
MKSFYEMIRILENQMPQNQMQQNQDSNSPQEPKFPLEIEKERQLRLSLKWNDEEERVWEIIYNALDKHGVPEERNISEWNVLYGKDIDATVFTHKNGPYSGIERVAGVVYPENWKEDKEDGGYYPVGFQINNKPFDARSIAVIHDISSHQSYSDVEQDFYDQMDIERTQWYSW